MTGIIDAHPIAEGAGSQRGPKGLTGFTATAYPTALIEQAKGVLIFRYAIAAEAAYSLLELWAAQTDATVDRSPGRSCTRSARETGPFPATRGWCAGSRSGCATSSRASSARGRQARSRPARAAC